MSGLPGAEESDPALRSMRQTCAGDEPAAATRAAWPARPGCSAVRPGDPSAPASGPPRSADREDPCAICGCGAHRAVPAAAATAAATSCCGPCAAARRPRARCRFPSPADEHPDRGHRGRPAGRRPGPRRALRQASRRRHPGRRGRMCRRGRRDDLLRREPAVPVAAPHRSLHEHLGTHRGGPGAVRRGYDRGGHPRRRATAGLRRLQRHHRVAGCHAERGHRRASGTPSPTIFPVSAVS